MFNVALMPVFLRQNEEDVDKTCPNSMHPRATKDPDDTLRALLLVVFL